MPSIPRDVRERLFEKVDVRGPEDCWLFQGALDGDSYGRISIEGRPAKAHRVVYRIYHDDLDDEYVNHHCDIPNCVNPNHLYKGDQSANIQDMWDRGRRDKGEMRGENSPSSILTRDQVDEIKERLEGDETYEEIAEDYPVSRSTIGSIANEEIWTYDDDNT